MYTENAGEFLSDGLQEISLETVGTLVSSGNADGFADITSEGNGWKSKTNTSGVYAGLKFGQATTVWGFRIANGTDFGVVDYEVSYSIDGSSNFKTIDLNSATLISDDESGKGWVFEWSVKVLEIRILVKKAWKWPGFKFSFFNMVSGNELDGVKVNDLIFLAPNVQTFRAINFIKSSVSEPYPEFFISYKPNSAEDQKLKKAQASIELSNDTFVCWNGCQTYKPDNSGYILVSPAITSKILRVSFKTKEKPNVGIKDFEVKLSSPMPVPAPMPAPTNPMLTPTKLNSSSLNMFPVIVTDDKPSTMLTTNSMTMMPTSTTMMPSSTTMMPSSTTMMPSSTTMMPSSTTMMPSSTTMMPSSTTMSGH